MTQDELKTLVGQAALQYVTPDTVVGVGTGSTVDKFIDALAASGVRIAGAVSSSVRSTERMKALGIPVLDASEVESLQVYIDGADEIDRQGHMVKGGGAALTREKIVADLAQTFVCIADESKLVDVLGAFPLPVEVIPMAAAQIARRFRAMGADVVTLMSPTSSNWWAGRLGVARDFSLLWGDGTNSRYNYLGVVLVALSLIGVVLAWRTDRRMLVWLVVGAAALLLALGPSIKISDVRGPLVPPITYQSYLMPAHDAAHQPSRRPGSRCGRRSSPRASPARWCSQVSTSS